MRYHRTRMSHRSQCRLGRTSLIDFADISDGLSNISLYSALSLDLTHCIRIFKKTGIIQVMNSYSNKKKKYFKKTLNNDVLILSQDYIN